MIICHFELCIHYCEMSTEKVLTGQQVCHILTERHKKLDCLDL